MPVPVKHLAVQVVDRENIKITHNGIFALVANAVAVFVRMLHATVAHVAARTVRTARFRITAVRIAFLVRARAEIE